MSKDLYSIDSGHDLNKDKHCDLDGWFVDKDGKHKPVVRMISRNSLGFGSPLYKESEIMNYFNISGNYYGANLNPLAVYTLNDENELLSSPNLNKMLRGVNPITYSGEKRIREIDKLINLSKTNKAIKVYRGIGAKFDDKFLLPLLKLNVGDALQDNGYMSTSYSLEHATSFAIGKDVAIMMEIIIPSGYNCIPLMYSKGSSSKKESEFEILLKRNSKLKIKSIRCSDAPKGAKEKHIVYYEMEVVK